jgi:hypothetical protein
MGKIIFGSTLKKYGVNTIKYLRRRKWHIVFSVVMNLRAT